ncbi:MAG: 3-deoxy-manno-octulosonate cytidylyltransferase [Bacteroidetes bacterium]|nr:3-deoxy-manno-octulosonate cytidylyltransferase [Bacteroidota bacterium]
MIAGIIPARYASSRFPGKPLAKIEGKTMIRRVYEQAIKSKHLDKVVVATDDDRIYRHVKDFGGHAVMTRVNHPSGTDRCEEALEQLGGGFDYVINIQGDEPFIDPSQIDALATVLKADKVEIATLIIRVDNAEILLNTGEVKVVLNPAMEALYFSRTVIPFLKDVPFSEWHLHRNYYRHVGMYAYRADILKQLTKLPVSSLEKAESLEQLRWLEAGFRVKCVLTEHDSHCIDTPEDIEQVLKLMRKKTK